MPRICWQTIFICGKPQWYGKPLKQLGMSNNPRMRSRSPTNTTVVSLERRRAAICNVIERLERLSRCRPRPGRGRMPTVSGAPPGAEMIKSGIVDLRAATLS